MRKCSVCKNEIFYKVKEFSSLLSKDIDQMKVCKACWPKEWKESKKKYRFWKKHYAEPWINKDNQWLEDQHQRDHEQHNYLKR